MQKLLQLWAALLAVIHHPENSPAKKQAMSDMHEAMGGLLNEAKQAAPVAAAVAAAVGQPELAALLSKVTAIADGVDALSQAHQGTVKRLNELTATVQAVQAAK